MGSGLVRQICNEVFQKKVIKNFIINQHDFVTPQMLTKRKENIPVSVCQKSKILSFISSQACHEREQHPSLSNLLLHAAFV